MSGCGARSWRTSRSTARCSRRRRRSGGIYPAATAPRPRRPPVRCAPPRRRGAQGARRGRSARRASRGPRPGSGRRCAREKWQTDRARERAATPREAIFVASARRRRAGRPSLGPPRNPATTSAPPASRSSASVRKPGSSAAGSTRAIRPPRAAFTRARHPGPSPFSTTPQKRRVGIVGERARSSASAGALRASATISKLRSPAVSVIPRIRSRARRASPRGAPTTPTKRRARAAPRRRRWEGAQRRERRGARRGAGAPEGADRVEPAGAREVGVDLAGDPLPILAFHAANETQ